MTNDKQKYVDISLSTGSTLRVEPVTTNIFRIRLRPDDKFEKPSLIRYGILPDDWAPVKFSTKEDDASVTISTGDASLSVSKADGRSVLRGGDGKVILEESGAPKSSPEKGFNAAFKVRDGEKFYGLGDETRDRIQKRGHQAEMWVKNVQCYVPIPFLMSTGGWAVLVNTTWRHFFDICSETADTVRFWSNAGELDYYLIVGETLPVLIERYTDISGKPHLLPLWGYGLTFVCNQQASARDMLQDGLNFRREEIPCDLIGLEPGWMSKNYDFSTQKDWHPDRFFLPRWGRKGPHTFSGALGRLGFKLSLWLCCDYDLSIAEENEWVAGQSGKEVEITGVHEDSVEKDEHLGAVIKTEEKTSAPEEPWFEHLKKFVDEGASAFKMDGSNQVIEHPKRQWANGMTDEEMHNLYPLLLNKQMSLGFKEHAERRAMIYSAGGYTGIQKYSATWAGDTGGGPKPLVSILNHGLSGHPNASCDMEVFSPAGIHFGFLMPWSQLCSWAYWKHPWYLGDKLLPVFKYYARLRYRLLPYIYSMAHIASRTGMPIMRSMNLIFPDDPKCENCMQQYMFGDAFLVGAFANKVYLPEGRWIDYWTGKTYEGKRELVCDVPEDRGGPLFIRAGAIIPRWPDVDYVGQKTIETISLMVYPEGKSAFTLYEDDGISYDYLEGLVAETAITCEKTDSVTLKIEPRSGKYNGMPENRSFKICLRSETPPKKVLVNGRPPVNPDGHYGWKYDAGVKKVQLSVTEDSERKTAAVVVCMYD